MGLLKSVRLELARMLKSNFGKVDTDNGSLLYDGDELNVGDEVFIENAERELEVPADGEYETETRVYVVEGGIVVEIRDKDSDSGDGDGGSGGGDMKEVSREEFNNLLSLVTKMAKQQEETTKTVNEMNADFQKFRKEPVENSANRKVNIKDKGGMSKEERFCRGEVD